MPLLLEYADDIARILIEYHESTPYTGAIDFEVVEIPYVEAA